MQKFRTIFNDKKAKQLIRYNIKGLTVKKRGEFIIVDGEAELENKAIELIRQKESTIVKKEALDLYFGKYQKGIY